MTRAAVLEQLAQALTVHPRRACGPVLRFAIDGVDGAGKTTFADELGAVLEQAGVPVIRAGVDGFHRPRAERYARGRTSPEGFYHDSYDYPALRRLLLDPLAPGGSGEYRTAAFDVTTDQPLDAARQSARPGSVLLLDGLFLHRPELREVWDASVSLQVPFGVSVPRGASRGVGYGEPDPQAASNGRYIGGQRLYFAQARPWGWASWVVDNTVLSAPVFV